MGLSSMADVVVRVAGAGDIGALASLRVEWTAHTEPGFEGRLAAWLAAEGERRTTWLAEIDTRPVGMASLWEYRRMPRSGQPDSRWGYLSNMFVREESRNRGVGSALLAAVVAAAQERAYVRIVLSPTLRSVPFYQRAGFVAADGGRGGELLLVRAL
jgi:GNAT superfamily N-acetyltransferase